MLIFLEQFFLCLPKIRIRHDAFVDRTNELALGLIVRTHALGALKRVDNINRVANGYGLIGTFDDTGVTVGAVFKDV